MTRETINNASESTKGIVHQFYVCLEKCFELEENESLFVEYYGDVTINDRAQIEVKKYKRALSNLDHNFWNTLKNWMDDSFKHKKFRNLVLCTTQSVSSHSIFRNWNGKDVNIRLEDLIGVHTKYLNRNSKNAKTLKLLDFILHSSKREKLIVILPKIIIQSSHKQDKIHHNSIRDRYAKGIPKSSQDKFIRGLLGFIISPEVTESTKWEVSYELFSNEVKELTKLLKEDSIIFPKKIELKNIDNTEYLNSIFVKKIESINYEEVIPEAISDYVHANTLIIRDMKSSMRYDNLRLYKKELDDDYKIKYRKAKRNKSESNIINNSQDFYDDFMGKDPKTFDDAVAIMASRVGLPPSEYKKFIDGTKILTLEEAKSFYKKGDGFASIYGSSKLSDDFNVANKVYDTPQDIDSYIDASLTNGL